MVFVKGHIPKNKILNRPKKPCKSCKKLFPMRSGDSYSQWELREYCSRKCRAALVNPFYTGHKINQGRKLTKKHKEQIKQRHSGSNSHFWKGGITESNKLIRSTARYREWRKSVFKKDGYRCFDCGEKGVYLQADHVYPFAYFPRLRFDINNGQALCVSCHKKTKTYGERAKQLYG